MGMWEPGVRVPSLATVINMTGNDLESGICLRSGPVRESFLGYANLAPLSMVALHLEHLGAAPLVETMKAT